MDSLTCKSSKKTTFFKRNCCNAKFLKLLLLKTDSRLRYCYNLTFTYKTNTICMTLE